MSHRFTVEVEWQKGLEGKAAPRGVSAEVAFAVPAEFGGPGGEWTPEHFFAAGINTCIMATFLGIAQGSKLPLASYSSEATATLEKTPAGLRMTEVEIRPRITVKNEADRDRALRLIEKAETLCPISHSVTAKVTLSPTVEVGS